MLEVLELNKNLLGFHITKACENAVELVNLKHHPVHFIFNEIDVTAYPSESAETVQSRWDVDREAAAKAYREHPDRIIEAAERERKDKEARAAHMVESAKTEAKMREAKVPWPLTPEQLTEYVESLVHKNHDYGTCCYAMSMAAEAAFNYVAHCLGVTGFQSSCADLDFLRRTRSMKGPFMILKAEDMLYPQYDLPEKLAKAMEDWKPWLKEEATKMLADKSSVHPDVAARWKELAESSVEVSK